MRGERFRRVALEGEMPAVLSTPGQPLRAHEIPDGAIAVTASGVCCLCDSRFHDEPVLAWRNPRVPGGWVYLEARHLERDPTPDQM